MPKRAFRIAYDGTGYRGFQRQPDVSTVEDALFDALRSLEAYEADDSPADRPAGYAAAGRTDAGVSALAQTIALEVPDWLTPRAMNGGLPADVRAWASADVPDSFHATHDASRRTYEYQLYAPAEGTDSSAPVDADARVDDERFRAACEALSGTHDVCNLTPDDRGTQRTLTVAATRDGDFLVVSVAASGFARELVRRLVSLARGVGAGERALERIDRVLSADPLPGPEGVSPAPPAPLVLTDVDYPGLEFETDDRAAASARAVFDERRVGRRTGARVAGRLADGVR